MSSSKSTTANKPKASSSSSWKRWALGIAVVMVALFAAARLTRGVETPFCDVFREPKPVSRVVECATRKASAPGQCLPHKCGRFVMDRFVSDEDVDALTEIANTAFVFGLRVLFFVFSLCFFKNCFFSPSNQQANPMAQ